MIDKNCNKSRKVKKWKNMEKTMFGQKFSTQNWDQLVNCWVRIWNQQIRINSKSQFSLCFHISLWSYIQTSGYMCLYTTEGTTDIELQCCSVWCCSFFFFSDLASGHGKCDSVFSFIFEMNGSFPYLVIKIRNFCFCRERGRVSMAGQLRKWTHVLKSSSVWQFRIL